MSVRRFPVTSGPWEWIIGLFSSCVVVVSRSLGDPPEYNHRCSSSCHRFFPSCPRPSHTRWTASWETSRTVKKTTAPNARRRPRPTPACSRSAHLCLILCLLELLLSETLTHESGHTKATQGFSLRLQGLEEGENAVASTGQEALDIGGKWTPG